MTTRASAWARLPVELKAYPQWAVAGASKAPLSVDASGKLFNTAVNRPSEWLSFERAAQLAWDNRELITTHTNKLGQTVTQTGLDIGFILNADDPFTCIDLDVKDATTHPGEPALHTTQAHWDLYNSIVRELDTYTELSRSGKGVHLWAKGNIGRGFRRDGVEVYSQERFIISTGNVVNDKPVMDRAGMLANMVSRMRPMPTSFELEELPEEVADWYILQIAFGASNADKFIELWEGRWQAMGFPSQSEADLALMSMLTFYSPSNAQVRRLFRDSKLGKREKAMVDDRYINNTLKTIRQREFREAQADVRQVELSAKAMHDLSQQTRNQEEQIAAEITRAQGGVPPAYQAPMEFGAPPSREVPPLYAGTSEPATTTAPLPVALAQAAPVSERMVKAGATGLPWPPGLAGYLAQYIYSAAPRPVKEVAIVAALGLLAGLCGKAWHIPKSGLNLYVILIARSAIGKEAMHQGISELVAACGRDNPSFAKFVDFSDYASGPALVKACVANPCFVNVAGEWGRKLKRIATEDRMDGPLQTLRTQMTNLYQKSGPQAILGGIGYSSTESNVQSVAGVSYSMIGETTPETFYESLTDSMMEDGFMSRLLLVQYEGDRPEPNTLASTSPDESLRSALNAISVQADQLIFKGQSMPVNANAEAGQLMQQFEFECDRRINGTKDESFRQMWNRASLKSMRVAALLAVASNWMNPVITADDVRWAQTLILNDIGVMQKRITSGDVGVTDRSRVRKLFAFISDYANATPEKLASYKVPVSLRDASIVPRSYLQIRASRTAAFTNHRFGQAKALDDTIASAIADGYLMDVSKDALSSGHNYHGRAFRILGVPNYAAGDGE